MWTHTDRVRQPDADNKYKWIQFISQFAKKIMYEQSPDQKETLRCILVTPPCEGIKLLLSLRELREFDHMLEEADTELQSSCLLKLFNN